MRSQRLGKLGNLVARSWIVPNRFQDLDGSVIGGDLEIARWCLGAKTQLSQDGLQRQQHVGQEVRLLLECVRVDGDDADG